MSILKTETIEVTYRDGRKERVQIVEVGFRTFLNCCGHGTHDTELAEAAVRLASSAAVYDRPVSAGWLDELVDDSAEAIVAISNKVNITATRAKKAGRLIEDRIARQLGLPTISNTSGAPSSS